MGHTAAPVTMRTLAERLGVSVTTVSNAYSKPDRLSPELREEILATAKELGYCGPSAAGRALRSGKTDVCGFLYGGDLSEAFADPYMITFLSGLSESVERFGASVLLLRSPGHEDGGERQLLQRAPIDAIVLCSAITEHPSTDLLSQRGVRVVGAQRSETGEWVAVNDVKAGRLIGKHLAKLGHHRVVVIVPGKVSENAPYELAQEDVATTCNAFAVERLQGLTEKLPDASLRIVCSGMSTRAAGRAAAALALDVQDRPTAIVAMSDVLAMGVWEAVAERALKPGRDISIAGFDDIPDAGFVGLTTVRQPTWDKGRLAGRLAMDPDYPQRQITLPVDLIVRSSTGPAPR